MKIDVILDNTAFHCLRDWQELRKTGVRSVKKKGAEERISLPLYECPVCKKKYINWETEKDLSHVKMSDSTYINLTYSGESNREDQLNHIKNKNEKLYRYYSYHGLMPKYCLECGKREFKSILVKHKDVPGPTFHAKYCPVCNLYYVDYLERKGVDNWLLMNPNDVSEFKNNKKKKRVDAKEAQKEAKKRRKEAEKSENKNRRVLQRRGKIVIPGVNISPTAKRKYSEETTASIKPVPGVKPSKDIKVRDFVVRRSSFKCRHQDHHVESIEGTLNIMDRHGNIQHISVPAGYCSKCNIFFILESTYQDLKAKGTPLCRVTDEKTFLKSSFSTNMNLAQESVLMQCGYNVSQQEGLSESIRRKMLTSLIDNHILTQSDIISYLDFFINQRKSQSKYEKAIEKWCRDREYISEYRKSEYEKIKIGGIHRQ